VYVAFSKDRIEVVTAREIEDKELAAARNPAYADLPLDGPRFVAIEVPKEEQNEALFQSLAGNEEHQRPKFFVPYETALQQIRKRARPLAALTTKFPASTPLVDAGLRELEIPAERVRWLPVHHRQGFWTALIDYDNGRPVGYVAFDPYGD
jgi:hypothetical protein